MADKTHEEFVAEFAAKIREKLGKEGLKEGAEKEIAENFVKALLKFKAAIEADSKSRQEKNGEISWSVERARLISDFAEELNGIFAPIGGLKPKEASAFWSGRGLKRAEDFGTDIGSTIPGFILNQVSSSLKQTFAERAYTAEGVVDTAVCIGMWEALSKVYATGASHDANIFLVDGETSSQSILWNTELHTMRLRQAEGEIGKIWVHTMHAEALEKYKELLGTLKHTKDAGEIAVLNKEIETLLKNPDNWEKKEVDESDAFKLKISGFSDTLKTVSFQTLKSAGRHFAARIAERKEDPEAYLQKRYEQPLAKIDKMIAAGEDLEIAFYQLKMLRNQIKLERMGDAYSEVIKTYSESISTKIKKVKSLIGGEDETLSVTPGGEDKTPSVGPGGEDETLSVRPG